MTTQGARIDKWLWAVRLFKTRSLATEFCKSGRVLIGGVAVKPSRLVQPGDVLVIRKPPVNYSYRVEGLISKRVSAPLAAGYYTDLTPSEELDKLKNIQESAFFVRERGSGRPTKKDRRELDKLTF